MNLGWLRERFASNMDRHAIVWRDRTTSYRELNALVDESKAALERLGIDVGHTVALQGDYSPQICAMLLALIERDAIVVPFTAATTVPREELMDIAEVRFTLDFDESDRWRLREREARVEHPLYRRLIAQGDPGLVLFSSGSTGKSKGAVHNFGSLLGKFTVPRHRLRTMTFLLLDHIGGINTLFYALSNGGTVVTVPRHDPDTVCRAIARHRVELLPTTPTFLNLLLVSEAHRRHDLSSLKLVTYGTEVMPESTLKRIGAILPDVRLLQTYGLSEVGILRSVSRGSDSLWVRVGGEGYETRVVDGVLWIRARSAMLGYLNAPSPFDADGWLNTGDAVEVDGEYIRILGRQSEIINVGGEKVYPAEVESELSQMENVRDVVVRGEGHPLTGHIVVARFNLERPERERDLRRRVREFCRGRLAPYKIPVKVEIAEDPQYGARLKRVRSNPDQQKLT